MDHPTLLQALSLDPYRRQLPEKTCVLRNSVLIMFGICGVFIMCWNYGKHWGHFTLFHFSICTFIIKFSMLEITNKSVHCWAAYSTVHSARVRPTIWDCSLHHCKYCSPIHTNTEWICMLGLKPPILYWETHGDTNSSMNLRKGRKFCDFLLVLPNAVTTSLHFSNSVVHFCSIWWHVTEMK
jgi:hypothetical protein